MRIISLFIISILFLTSCFESICTNKPYINQQSNNKEVDENFLEFLRIFYSDTSFQMNRIITPLKGEKKLWDEKEDIIVTTNWEENEIPRITSFDKIHESIDKAIQEFVKKESRVIEKIYVPNSGFYLKRTFEMQNNKWHLVRYDISYI